MYDSQSGNSRTNYAPAIRNKYLVLDIETAANRESIERVELETIQPDSKLSRTDKPPKKILAIKGGELKAQELAKWIAAQEKRLKASVTMKRAKKRDRLGLHWTTLKIVCIVVIDSSTLRRIRFIGKPEKELLRGLFSALLIDFPHHTLIGKNSSDFDLPVILGRALVHNIGLPPHLHSNRPITDINRLFGVGRAPQTAALEEYAWALGIPGKLGKGTDVEGWHESAEQGDAEAEKLLCDYCEQDALIVLEMLKRYEKPFQLPLPPPLLVR